MADELRIEAEPSSRLGVRLRAQGGGRRATAAIVAGVLGLGAFVASLLQEWLRITTTFRGGEFGGGDVTVEDGTATLNLDVASFSAVYQLGVLALLALLASVVIRPDLAARYRLAAVGLGLGVAGVAGAALAQLRGYTDVLSIASPITNAYTVDYKILPGVYFAGGAVVALVAGVWLAAAPSDGARPPSAPEVGARSGVARLVGNHGAAVSFVAGVAGAGAFVASMLLAWQRIETPTSPLFGVTSEPLANLGLADTGAGVVYLLGALALLGLVGAAAVRPGLGPRLRPAVAGLGLGLAAVLVGTVFEMRHWMLGRFGALSLFVVSDEARSELDLAEYSLQPGFYLGVGAILVLVAGVWLSAAPSTTPGAATAAPVMAYAAVPEGYVLVPASAVLPVPTSAVPTSPAPVDGPDVADGAPPTAAAPPPPASVPVSGPAANWLTPVGYADGLSVTASDPIDIGNQSDILRS